MAIHGARNHARPSSAQSRTGPIPVLVAAICASELVLVFVNVALGVLLHAVVLLGILALQAGRSERLDGRALIPLALVPLLRLLSLTMVLPGIDPLYWAALVGLPLVVGGVLAARASGLGLQGLGLSGAPWRPQLAIALLGLPGGLAVWRLGGGASVLPDGASAGEIILIGLVLVLFVGITEEFIFRGVIPGGLSLVYADGAIDLAAVHYGASYLGSLSAGYAASMALAGLLYGLAVRRTGSIAGVGASHALLVVSALLGWPALLGTA
jgi:membrane protease YdiL (CAAX protease family)